MILGFFNDVGTFFASNPLYLVAVAGVLIAIVIVAFAISGCRKKQKKAKQAAAQDASEPKETSETEPASPAEEKAEEAPAAQPQKESVNEPAQKKEAVSEQPAKKAEPAKKKEKPAQKEAAKPAEKKPQQESAAQEADDKSEKNYAEETIYHVTRRKEDGKWQVKLQKGDKAIRLFDTQAEAYAHAKKLAEAKEGTVHVHKVSGQIRKFK